MLLQEYVVSEDTWIRFGGSFDAQQSKSTTAPVYGGGEPAVLVPAGTKINKFKTEYGRNQYTRSLQDFIKLLEQFPENVICRSGPGSWEHTTLEAQNPEYKDAVKWRSVPYTENWQENAKDLGDIHF